MYLKRTKVNVNTNFIFNYEKNIGALLDVTTKFKRTLITLFPLSQLSDRYIKTVILQTISQVCQAEFFFPDDWNDVEIFSSQHNWNKIKFRILSQFVFSSGIFWKCHDGFLKALLFGYFNNEVKSKYWTCTYWLLNAFLCNFFSQWRDSNQIGIGISTTRWILFAFWKKVYFECGMVIASTGGALSI